MSLPDLSSETGHMGLDDSSHAPNTRKEQDEMDGPVQFGRYGTVEADNLLLDWQPLHNLEFKSFAAQLLKHTQHNPSLVQQSWLNTKADVVRSFTRKQLWDYSGSVAEMLLRDHGVKRGDRLMVVFPFGIDWIISFIACMRIGAIVVSVYPPDPSKLDRDIPKFARFVQDSGSRVALTVDKYQKLVAATSLLRKGWPSNLKWIATDKHFVSEDTAPQLRTFDVVVSQDDIAFIQYTSGSTGNPKGVMITHGNLSHQAQILDNGTDFITGEANSNHYVGWAPQYHDMGLFAVLAPLFNGWDTSYSMSPLDWLQDPTLWARAIERYRGSMSVTPNFGLELTCKRLKEKRLSADCSCLKVVVVGAEPVRLRTLQEAHSTMKVPAAAMNNVYGLAEHGVFVISAGTRIRSGVLSAGNTLFASKQGVHVRIAQQRIAAADDEEGAVLEGCEDGVAGEICVSSASVARGYWGKPELSDRVFRARFADCPEREYLRTGDIGFVEGAELFMTSRLKDLIIVNGKNFSPSDLEYAAETAHSSILRPGSSVAFQSDSLGVVLVCELRKGQQAQRSIDDLVNLVRRTVENECDVALDNVTLLPERTVPKTTSGKVQRSKTAELMHAGALKPLAATAQGRKNLEAARSLGEMLDALGVEDRALTVGQNGVTSLQMTQLVSAAQRTLAIELDFASLATLSAQQLLDQCQHSAPRAAVKLTTCPAEPISLPPVWLRLVRQLCVLLLCLLAIVASAMPSVALVEHSFDRESGWWLSRGRGGPLVIGVVLLWMASYTAALILLKWLLLGRQRPGFVPLWSSRFMCWMMVQRLAGTWEYAVGRFLVTSPWINLVYKLLGADVAWTARVDAFFRDWDLVSAGAQASIKGSLYPRQFQAAGANFGHIAVGDEASVGAMSVVMPFSVIDAQVALEACAVAPAFSDLDGAGSRWHGSPCQRRDPKAQEAAPPSASAPLFLTRAMLPLLVLGATASAAYVSNCIVPEAEHGDLMSDDLVWLVVSYMLVFCLTGLQLLAFLVMLKWSFVSPFLTDRFAGIVATSFFSWLERSPLVNVWHGLFGMKIGPQSRVFFTRFCSPSSAHLVELGADVVIFNGFVAPPDAPSLWSWVGGTSAAPWRQRQRSIRMGSNIRMYVQSRVEADCVVGDGCECAAFSRLGPSTTLQPRTSAVGDPAAPMQYQTGANPSADRGRFNPGLYLMHLLLMLLHWGWLAGGAMVGLQLMLEIGDWGWNAYLRIAARLLFALGWLHLMLALEVVIVKWLVVGRARPERFALRSLRGVGFLHLATCESGMHTILATLSYGLFLIEWYLVLLGFHVKVGTAFINSGNYAASDADLTTVKPGAIIDDNAYVSAHAATTDEFSTGRVFVDSNVVLHPWSAMFLGSLEDGAQLFPRSKPLSVEHIRRKEAWIGAPSRLVLTETASELGSFHLRSPSSSMRKPRDNAGTSAWGTFSFRSTRTADDSDSCMSPPIEVVGPTNQPLTAQADMVVELPPLAL